MRSTHDIDIIVRTYSVYSIFLVFGIYVYYILGIFHHTWRQPPDTCVSAWPSLWAMFVCHLRVLRGGQRKQAYYAHPWRTRRPETHALANLLARNVVLCMPCDHAATQMDMRMSTWLSMSCASSSVREKSNFSWRTATILASWQRRHQERGRFGRGWRLSCSHASWRKYSPRSFRSCTNLFICQKPRLLHRACWAVCLVRVSNIQTHQDFYEVLGAGPPATSRKGNLNQLGQCCRNRMLQHLAVRMRIKGGGVMGGGPWNPWVMD